VVELTGGVVGFEPVAGGDCDSADPAIATDRMEAAIGIAKCLVLIGFLLQFAGLTDCTCRRPGLRFIGRSVDDGLRIGGEGPSITSRCALVALTSGKRRTAREVAARPGALLR
jgi:hypothetical protein